MANFLGDLFSRGSHSSYVDGGMPVSAEEIPVEKQREILEKLAREIVERGLAVPAIFFLETVKPLSFLGTQAMVFFHPIVSAIFPSRIYGELTVILERRENVEWLICAIERLDGQIKEEGNEGKTGK